MTNTDRMTEKISDPDKLPRYALYGLLGVVISFSVAGWITSVPGVGGWAGAATAAFLEVLVFFGLPKVLAHIQAKQWAKLSTLGIIIIMAGFMNAVGVDRGLELAGHAWQAPLDAQVAQEQAAIDRRHAELLTEISDIEARLRAASATMPNPETTNRDRQAQWRANYQAATALDQARLIAARHEKDALPTLAEPRRAYPEEARHLFAAFLFFISMFGRFSWGFEAPAKQAPKKRHPKQDVSGERSEAENVFDFATEQRKRRRGKWDEATKETVRQLHASGVSLRDIEEQTGVPFQTAGKWTQAK